MLKYCIVENFYKDTHTRDTYFPTMIYISEDYESVCREFNYQGYYDELLIYKIDTEYDYDYINSNALQKLLQNSYPLCRVDVSDAFNLYKLAYDPVIFDWMIKNNPILKYETKGVHVQESSYAVNISQVINQQTQFIQNFCFDSIGYPFVNINGLVLIGDIFFNEEDATEAVWKLLDKTNCSGIDKHSENYCGFIFVEDFSNYTPDDLVKACMQDNPESIVHSHWWYSKIKLDHMYTPYDLKQKKNSDIGTMAKSILQENLEAHLICGGTDITDITEEDDIEEQYTEEHGTEEKENIENLDNTKD